MREDGYYWCLTCHGWKPVEWVVNCWFLDGQDAPVSDDWFIEIDERRIVRQESKGEPDYVDRFGKKYYKTESKDGN